MINCVICNNDNPDGTFYCQQCGNKLKNKPYSGPFTFDSQQIIIQNESSTNQDYIFHAKLGCLKSSHTSNYLIASKTNMSYQTTPIIVKKSFTSWYSKQIRCPFCNKYIDVQVVDFLPMAVFLTFLFGLILYILLNSTAGFGTYLIVFIIFFGILSLVGKHSLDKYGTVNLPQVTIKQSKKSKIKGHKVFDLQRFGNSP